MAMRILDRPQMPLIKPARPAAGMVLQYPAIGAVAAAGPALLILLISMAVLLILPARGYPASSVVSVSATVLSKSQCKFQTQPVGISFGSIDASMSGDATASTTAVIRCGGSAPIATYSLSGDNGQHFLGTERRMQNGSGEFMAYSLSIVPSSGDLARNTNLNIDISGTIAESVYKSAPVGAYADTLIVTLSP